MRAVRMRVFAGCVLAGVVGASLVAVPASGATRAAAQGVTKDEIVVVALVADLDGLRARGLIQQPKLTTGNLTKRWQAYVDEFGPINGRTIRIETVTWDPTDATTFEKACLKATQDVKPFVVLNSSGFRQSSVGCITIDNQTPMIVGDPMYTELLKQSGNRLWSTTVPSDVAGTATANVVANQKLVPKTAKIGILSGNEPGLKAGADALQKQLEKLGYAVASRVEVNILASDPGLLNRESNAAVGTFKAAGVDTVFIGIPFTASQGYFQEAQRTNAGFENFIIDVSASMCTIFAAGRIPVEAAGTPCVTAADTRALPTKDGVKKDSPAEAKCRATFDAAFATRSQPGVPSGDVVAGGVTYNEDFPFDYCNITNVLLPAIKKAGKNLTWDKVARNMERMTSVDTIYLSGGKGSFGKDKHYLADNVHLVVLNPANTQTPRDANGLFNGCPAPVNCWVPQLVDGKEWFPIGATSAKKG